PTAHHVFLAGELQNAPADILIASTDLLDDTVDRDLVGEQAVRVDRDLVLADEPTDRGHFRDAGNGAKLILDLPILQRAQIGERMPAGFINQGIFQRPADPCRIRPQLWRDALRQFTGHATQVFQYTAAGPVKIRAVLENHINQ